MESLEVFKIRAVFVFARVLCGFIEAGFRVSSCCYSRIFRVPCFADLVCFAVPRTLQLQYPKPSPLSTFALKYNSYYKPKALSQEPLNLLSCKPQTLLSLDPQSLEASSLF